MPAHAFDTLKAADALMAAGIDPKHARAITETMRDAVTGGVAAKADIAELKADIAALKSRLDAMQWVLGFIAAMQILMAGRMFGAF